MKKLFLILSLISVIATVQAQSQLKTVRGKTKEGKSIVVRYYQGTFEDNIESVKYEVIDELQNKVKEQQNKVTNLQSSFDQLKTKNNKDLKELEELGKQVKKLNEIIKNDSIENHNSVKVDTIYKFDTIYKEISVKVKDPIMMDSLDMLNRKVDSLIKINYSIKIDNDALRASLNSEGENLTSTEKKGDESGTQTSVIPAGSSDESAQELLRQNDGIMNESNKSTNKGNEEETNILHSISIESRIGQVIYGHTVNEDWNHDIKFSKHVSVYYGSPNLTKSEEFPITIEAGVGATFFDMSANRSAYGLILDGQSDIDNDVYQAQYSYSNLNERLSLTYFDVPIRICFGQPKQGQASVYAKIGLTPSILVHSNFFGEGTYTLKGYYEDLQITLENVSELGFVNNADCYNEGSKPDLSRFMLWGNVAVGAYVPFGKSPVQLNFGFKVDYSITSIGKAVGIEALPEGMGLLSKGDKVIVPSAVIGIVYTIK